MEDSASYLRGRGSSVSRPVGSRVSEGVDVDSSTLGGRLRVSTVDDPRPVAHVQPNKGQPVLFPRNVPRTSVPRLPKCDLWWTPFPTLVSWTPLSSI